MKILVAVLLFLVTAAPTLAADMSVQQLADLLDSAATLGQSDKKIARKIAGPELTQRLTDDTLATLLQKAPGPLTRDALQTLADESAFLDPPRSEVPDAPAPTPEEQTASLTKARNYAASYVRNLPNFLCTLIVRRFDDGTSGKGLRFHDTVTGELTFKSGKESIAVRDVSGIESNVKLTQGLRTHDEVGGLLSSLFSSDTLPPFVWSHWENLNGRRVAVFHYSLDKAHSHFTVTYCCRPGRVTYPPITIATAAAGELSIDTASGIVFRVTEQAVDMPSGFPLHRAEIMVQYAAVVIGKQFFICPTRSITISDVGVHDLTDVMESFSLSANLHSLNEMQFTNYHEFQTESRLVVAEISNGGTPPSSSPAAVPAPVQSPVEDQSVTELTKLPPPVKEDVSGDKPVSPPEQAIASLPPVARAEDIAPRAVAKPVDQAELAPSVSFKVRVNVVTVRAVVRDAQGHVVDDLRKEDFELFDNSKLEGISGFSVERPAIPKEPSMETSVQYSAGAQVTSVARAVGGAPSYAPERYVVYLFDDLHMTVGTLSTARKAAQRALADPPDSNTRVAITTTSGRVVLDFTDDPTKLAQALSRIKPSSSNAHFVCPPEMSYYIADQIINEVDARALSLAIMEQVDCNSHNPQLDARSTAEITLTQHEVAVRAALSVLKTAIRRLALMPGQRSIILVSPGFLTTSMPSEIGDVIDHASRSSVVISTMDARELYVPPEAEEIEASTAAVDSHHNEEVQLRQEYSDRGQAAVSGVLGQLANGTGGTFFQNSNDLYAGFKQLGATPEVFYLLGFTPHDLKPDGKYHKLRVAIKDRKGLIVRARDGYYAPKTLADPGQQAKDEIENAVFSRDEIREIPIVLKLQPPAPGAAAPKMVATANVNLRSVAFQEHDGHNHNSILATFTLFDSDGKYIQGQQNKIELDYTKEQLAAALSAGLNLKSEFDVKPGRYVVRGVVRDEQGQMSASSKAVEVQ